MRKKARTTRKKQTGTSKEAPIETKELPRPSKVRVGRWPVDKPIGNRQPKKIIRVSGHLEFPSMSRKNKEVVK